MSWLRGGTTLLAILSLADPARAGLYYSAEVVAELPSRWRGFLTDQRALRGIAVKPDAKSPATPLRKRYREEADKLEKRASQRQLGADELADLGALYVRLGEVPKAVEVLRVAQRRHPKHFHVLANLGTAWQLQGDLAQAAAMLQQAVRLAPGKLQKAEECQLTLVRARLRQGRKGQPLDDLFGIRYADASGKYEAGTLAASERGKLTADHVAIAQRLALWLPADAQLLWQLAELANAYGDVKTAAAMMDGCVTQFGLTDPDLRKHRHILRAAADALAMGPANVVHKTHRNRLPARSARPLVAQFGAEKLPSITADGVNALPWAVLSETTLSRKYKPTFVSYLQQLDGKTVELSGFMQPLNENVGGTSFLLIEYPVGCWYCEMPEMTGIIMVELVGGTNAAFTRGLVKVVGRLRLNATDPEKFLYTVTDAKVAEAY